MSYKKKIVCLANSRKPPSGRCIVGREVLPEGLGNWIRPVSNRPSREISEEERQYFNGKDPRVLDLIEITFIKPEPENHQKENHLIDENYYWEYIKRYDWRSIRNAIDEPKGSLWRNGFSSRLGLNDRIPGNIASRLKVSLYLISPNNLVLKINTEGGGFGPPRRRIRACFDFNNESYCLVVTDPVIERKYLSNQTTVIEMPNALLCVSLGEIFKDYAYKLAAAIITPE